MKSAPDTDQHFHLLVGPLEEVEGPFDFLQGDLPGNDQLHRNHLRASQSRAKSYSSPVIP